ncbi:DUF1579 domain-containing protein [Corallococcus aberystwythensis]|uniref:DUF1579 domain-containing protein n=1 Tax=Corallococcus aberystwythensis TaxID=2316722 RepID=A0A3A8QBY0_9BACT|nr:DUF1579 domain-containing protein [Corallococcus aberystwythensis]RKH63765.1 DUF1579 domain-containing protein [Corallococcus aberystwythensis]
MSQERLQQSQSAGPHHLLSRLVGAWEGVARTWFQPDKLEDESPISGTFRSVLDGRFVVHEYTSAMGGKPLSGVATLGYHLDKQQFTMSWVDTFHVGTDIMPLLGEPGVSDRISVTGSYFTGEQSPRWGWRVDIEVKGPDALVITHFNIEPGAAPQKAIEIQYKRRS